MSRTHTEKDIVDALCDLADRRVDGELTRYITSFLIE